MTRRRLAAALALAMAVAACGADGDSSDPPAAPAVTDTGGAPATRPPDDGGSPTTAVASPPPTRGGEAPATSLAPSTTASTVAEAPPPAPAGVGAFAAFYLRPEESASIVVDVHSQTGAEPRSATLEHLRSVLGEVSGKPVSVALGSADGGGRRWSSADIRALADSLSPDQTRDRAVLTVLYLRGEFEERAEVVGIAVRSDVVAVFGDKVAEAAGVLGNPAAVEDAVSMHELGHVLGLVDLVLDTGREDPEHPGHSPNRGSVMYYAVESTLIGTIFEGGPPRDFDSADRDDLARIRNG